MKIQRNIKIFALGFSIALAGLLLSPRSGWAQQNSKQQRQQAVEKKNKIPEPIRGLVAGFNAGDPKKMGEFVTKDCEIRYVDQKGAAAVGTRGRDQLIKEMQGYFRSVKNVRSELSQVSVAGRFVSAKETVGWDSRGKRRSQYSLVVFELDSNKKLIARVWYFPAQK